MAKKGKKNAEKAQGKKDLAVSARYDAAGNGRRLSGWIAPPTGPNRATEGQMKLRDRSRDASRNEWAGASTERVMKTNLIGVGIQARFKTKDAKRKAKLRKWWADFAASADADGVLDLFGLEALVVGSWFTSGEVFARLRPRRTSDGLPVPMQVQLLESDMVPVFNADVWPGMSAGNKIRQGIEFNLIGKRVAYWMYREHPGDSISGVSSADLVRVPAESVLHIYNPRRPGQLRGVPEMAPSLTKLRAVMDFDDATLERQRIANLYVGFYTSAAPAGGDLKFDPLTGKTIESYEQDGGPVVGMMPGIMQQLRPGEDVKFSDPPGTGGDYREFMRQQYLGVGAGPGVPYELMSGDIREVSDRSLRVVITEFRRYCQQLQWLMIIPQFCRPIIVAAANASLLAGYLTAEEAADAIDVEWQPHGWDYINPTQDVEAKGKEIEYGIRARSQIISENGDDPDEVDTARAEDQAREKRLGVEREPASPTPSAQPAPDGATA